MASGWASALVLLVVTAATVASAADERVYVIAKSISTSNEARRILAQNHWVQSDLSQADLALVVVRSEVESPLTSTTNVRELEREADRQANMSGTNFVMYLYRLDADLRPTEVRRTAYPAPN